MFHLELSTCKGVKYEMCGNFTEKWNERENNWIIEFYFLKTLLSMQQSSESWTPEIRTFEFLDTFLSGFQMAWLRDKADHLKIGHFWPLNRHVLSCFQIPVWKPDHLTIGHVWTILSFKSLISHLLCISTMRSHGWKRSKT